MDLQRDLISLLEQYPSMRSSINRIVVGYWTKREGLGVNARDFDHLTSVEAISREVRRIAQRRPELTPHEHAPRYGDLFSEMPTPPAGTTRGVEGSLHAATTSPQTVTHVVDEFNEKI